VLIYGGDSLAVEIELMTDFEPEHKIKCEKCECDKFYVFDDKEAGSTDVVCVKCGELRMNWL
jgi:hypothetical protein